MFRMFHCFHSIQLFSKSCFMSLIFASYFNAINRIMLIVLTNTVQLKLRLNFSGSILYCLSFFFDIVFDQLLRQNLFYLRIGSQIRIGNKPQNMNIIFLLYVTMVETQDVCECCSFNRIGLSTSTYKTSQCTQN